MYKFHISESERFITNGKVQTKDSMICYSKIHRQQEFANEIFILVNVKD